MVESEKPTFVLGVGAQKAGTSWLDYYLRASPGVDLGIKKEYHIWDVKYLSKELPKLSSKFSVDEKSMWDSRSSLVRYLMLEREGSYESYFRSLLQNDIHIVGDITPSYAALRQNHFEYIKQKLESVGFRVKVIFLVRDPVQRCWSAVRMNVRKSNVRLSTADANKIFQDRFRKPDCISRTKYEDTLKSLEAVFEVNDVYLGVYEEMFECSEVARLSKFLCVPTNLAFADKKINSSDQIDLNPGLAKDCFSFYRSTYERFNFLYPQTIDLWREY